MIMKLCALFSGGKDSAYAIYKAINAGHSITCLLTIESKNPESYMYHLPNIHLTKLQAKAMNKKHYIVQTSLGKEDELKPLKETLKKIKKEQKIEGVVTGAIASSYQKNRIQKICDELELKCINPLWEINQIQLLYELIETKFEVMIVGVAAQGLEKEWLGRRINEKTIKELEKIEGINPAGEGGETESLVTNCPLFKKKLKIIESEKKWFKNKGELIVKKARLF
jgi:diphthine-ammonia ligase